MGETLFSQDRVFHCNEPGHCYSNHNASQVSHDAATAGTHIALQYLTEKVGRALKVVGTSSYLKWKLHPTASASMDYGRVPKHQDVPPLKEKVYLKTEK